jgi:hypothetical protein
VLGGRADAARYRGGVQVNETVKFILGAAVISLTVSGLILLSIAGQMADYRACRMVDGSVVVCLAKAAAR